MALLALERMRIIDVAHSWASNTYAGYQSKLNVVRRFEEQFDLSILPQERPSQPSSNPIIPLLWCQEAYSLQAGSSRRPSSTVAFGTIRQLRSAVSQVYAWEAAVQPTAEAFLDSNSRLVHQSVRPTDQLVAQLHATGMATRLGTITKPSTALLDRHVRSLDSLLRQRWEIAPPQQRRELSLLAMANLLLWLGWLRSSETLDLRWKDISVVPPADGPTVDLPLGIGAVILQLAPETKSNRTGQGSVVIAFTTISRLSLGQWILRSLEGEGLNLQNLPNRPIFLHRDGTKWTSQWLRESHLYPHLRHLREEGDPYLQPIHSIAAAFWSLHCYRRGARSHVSKTHPGHRMRRATAVEVYEHGRWRKKRGEDIDKMYQEWTIYDRIQLTLHCM